MFIAIYPYKYTGNFKQALTKLGIEYAQGTVVQPFISPDADCVQNFDFAGITHSSDNHVLIPEDFGATKDVLEINEITVVNFIEDEMIIENLNNRFLNKCEMLFSFRMSMDIKFSQFDGMDDKQKKQLETATWRVLEAVKEFIVKTTLTGINFEQRSLNEYRIIFDVEFLNIKVSPKLKNTLDELYDLSRVLINCQSLIEDLEKYDIGFSANIPEFVFSENNLKLKKTTQGNKAYFYDKSEGVFLNCGYSEIENGFFGNVASVYFSNVSNKLKREVEPYGYRDFEPFQRNANIVDPVKSLSIYPAPEQIFSPHQPWVNRMFVPVFSIDMGSYRSEWNGLELPFVLPVFIINNIKEGLTEDCYYGNGYIAFHIDKQNYLYALFQENELFDFDNPSDSTGQLRMDFLEFHQRDLEFFQQKKQYFKENGNHGSDYLGKRNIICNFGGEAWDGNWSSSKTRVPNNIIHYQAKTDTPQLIDKQGNKFFYIADTEMANWIHTGGTALMFYEPKNRIILYTFDWD